MSLFRAKKKDPVASAFDQIPDEAQAKLIEDVLSIVRTLKEWPNVIPKELHQAIGNELQGMLRKSLSKLIPMFMSSDESVDFGKAFGDINPPTVLKQMFLAVCLGLATPAPTTVIPEDPNGTAA